MPSPRIRIAEGAVAGGGAGLLLIAGPDSIESEAHALRMAQALKGIAAARGITLVYKSSRVLIQMLVDVVAKGGNLLLNIGPGPDGAWHDAAYDRLAALGAWMKDNSEAIYGTRPMAPYSAGQMRFTRARDGVVFAIYLPGTTETAMPARVAIAGVTPAAGSTVLLLGAGGAGQAIPWERSADGCVLLPPGGVAPPNADAWVFRMSSTAR